MRSDDTEPFVKSRLPFIVGWLLVAAAAAWVARRSDVLHSLGSVSVAALAGMSLAYVAALGAAGLNMRTLALLCDVRLDFVEWFGLTVGNSMYNLVLPGRAGVFARGFYLHRRHGLPPGRFMAIVLASAWHMLLASALVLLFATILRNGPANLLGFAIAIVAGLVGTAIILGRSPRERLPGETSRLGRLARDAFEGVAVFRNHRPDGCVVFVQSAVFILLSAASLGIACVAVGQTPSPTGVAAAAALVSLSSVVALTPGNLGVKEAITASCAGLLGVDAEHALLASLVDRAVAMVVVVALGLAFNRALLRRVAADDGGVRPAS